MDHREAVQSMAAERYLLEEMSELERHAFEEHYFSCPECADDVRAGALLRTGVKEGLASVDAEPKPIAFAPRPATRAWKPAVVVPWAAAATLALVVGYQATTDRRADALDERVVALAPVALRPASRGAEAIIAVPTGAVTLALEVNTVGVAGPLSYELADGRGNRVGAGTADLPPAGLLLLLIPGSTLEPSGRYTLSVRGGDQLVGEYRFAVAAK